MGRVAHRQREEVRRFRAPCEWCEIARDCDGERRLTVKVRYICTMFDDFPYQCPDHAPVWFKGIEGCRP
jgi:hypothetical protein